MKTICEPHAIAWHLHNNVGNLASEAVQPILDICAKFNAGEYDLDTRINETESGDFITVGEMFEDLKIEIE